MGDWIETLECNDFIIITPERFTETIIFIYVWFTHTLSSCISQSSILAIESAMSMIALCDI